MAHCFNKNSQMELPASRNFITIQRVSPSHKKSNNAIQFFKEAITNQRLVKKVQLRCHKWSLLTQAIAS
jgi:hypothetical protein